MTAHALHHLASVSVPRPRVGGGRQSYPRAMPQAKGYHPPLKGTPTRFYMRVMRTPFAW